MSELMNHEGAIIGGVPNAGCRCMRCEYLRETPGTGPDHVGAYELDTLDPSNADCRCRRCEWLRAKVTGAQPTTEMDDVETEPQCRACLRAWADCNCPAKGNA